MSTVASSEKLAIDGGTPVRDQQRPWSAWPAVSESEWEHEVEPKLRSVYLGGEEGLPASAGQAFEQAFARFCQAAYGVIMPHGTDAIAAALAGTLDLDGLGEGGEIILPNYTFIATASAPLSLQCSLSLVDIDPVSCTIDPAAVEAAITDKTVAILPVHLAGHPADMEALSAIAEKYGLAIIEDCAQAHGAEFGDRPVGSLGDAGAFSFQSSKNLTSGEGGCMVTNNPDIRDRAYAFKDVGRRPGGERWEYPRLGWNYRTSEYIATLLLHRLETLDDQTGLRNENAGFLAKGLEQIGGLTYSGTRDWVTRHGYHLFVMKYDPEGFGGTPRKRFVASLSAEGIPCSTGYSGPPTDATALTTVRERYPDRVRRHDCPNVEAVSEHSVWFSQRMLFGGREDLEDILEAVSKLKRLLG